LNRGFVDLHVHILPGLDDGAGTLDESLAMAGALGQMGYSRIIATPHRIAGLYDASSEEVEAALALLVEAVRNLEGVSLKLSAARECHFDRLLMDDSMEGDFVTISKNTKAFLFELPFGAVPVQLTDFLFRAGLKGFVPVLVHPERNRELVSNHKLIDELKSKGVRLVVNLGSLVGGYGRAAKKTARWIIDNQLADAAATDAHSVQDVVITAAKAISEIESRWGSDAVTELLQKGPMRLLNEPGG